MFHSPTEFHLLSLFDIDKKTEVNYKPGFRTTKIQHSHILTEGKKKKKKRIINNIKSSLFFSNVIVEFCINFQRIHAEAKVLQKE